MFTVKMFTVDCVCFEVALTCGTDIAEKQGRNLQKQVKNDDWLKCTAVSGSKKTWNTFICFGIFQRNSAKP